MYAIQETYLKENHYHNHIHSADVTQAMFYYLETCEGTSILELSDMERMSALVAAGIHDVNHPGYKNDLISKRNEQLSIVYSD